MSDYATPDQTRDVTTRAEYPERATADVPAPHAAGEGESLPPRLLDDVTDAAVAALRMAQALMAGRAM